MFELTVHFKHEMIGFLPKFSKKLRIKWNFELTVFELTVPDLYYVTLRDHLSFSIIRSNFVLPNSGRFDQKFVGLLIFY